MWIITNIGKMYIYGSCVLLWMYDIWMIMDKGEWETLDNWMILGLG